MKLKTAFAMLSTICITAMIISINGTPSQKQAVISKAYENSGNYEGFRYEKSSGGTQYVITGYTGDVSDVVIPEKINGIPVTEIAYMAFRGCNFTSITIPDSIIRLNQFALYGCNYLDISIGNNVTYIGSDVFSRYDEKIDGVYYVDGWVVGSSYSVTSADIKEGTKGIIGPVFDGRNITSVTIPDSVIRISSDAFSGCTEIQEIEDGIIYVDNWAIGCDSKITTAKIRPGTKGIADYAFSESTITDIVIPDGVSFIGIGAFSECDNLVSVSLPDSITEISRDAFDNCDNLKSITIPDTVTKIGYGAFTYCTSLEEIDIPNSVTKIGAFAFEHCTNLVNVTTPNNLETIEFMSFAYCSSLKAITIPNSVTNIELYAFDDCSSLTSIIIPDSVNSINECAFNGCNSLISITILNPECVIYDSRKTISGVYYEDYNWIYDFTGIIYGYDNSTAQAYADKYEYKFESLGVLPIYKTGDITCDGSVDVADVILLQKYILGVQKINYNQYLLADLNGDEEVNVFDLVLLKRKVISLKY